MMIDRMLPGGAQQMCLNLRQEVNGDLMGSFGK